MNRHAKSLIITIVFLFGFLPTKPFIFAPTIPVLLSWGGAVLDVSGKLAAFYLLGKRFNHRHLPIANAPVPAAPESTEVYGFMSEPGKPIIFEDLPHEVQQDLLQQVQPIATANPATPTLQPSTTTTPVLKTIPPASTKTLANQAASSALKAASNDLLSPQSLAKMKAAAQTFKTAEGKHMLMKGLSNQQGRELVAKIVPAKSLAAKLIATSKDWAGKGVEKILPYAPIIGPVISAYSVYSNIETLKAAYHTYNAGNSDHDKPVLKNSGNTPPSQDDDPNKKLKDGAERIIGAKKLADELNKKGKVPESAKTVEKIQATYGKEFEKLNLLSPDQERLDHIKSGHIEGGNRVYSTDKPPKTLFLNEDELMDIAIKTIKDGKSDISGRKYTYDFGKPIGKTVDGKLLTKAKVVTGKNKIGQNRIVTMFPFE